MARFLVTRLMILSLVIGSAAPLDAQQTAAPASQAAAALVNLNTATPAQLATLPGVGPKTAELIVEHREKNGGFKKIEELMHVKGIGEKSFLRLKELVTVGDDTPAARK